MIRPEEHELIDAAKQLQRRGEAALDELTVARLRAARRRAIDEVGRRSRFNWLAAGGVATAGVALTIAALVWFQAPTDTPAGGARVADLDLLITETPEFYVDLEFYDWLARDRDDGDTG